VNNFLNFMLDKQAGGGDPRR